jgi:hypothetical protein
MKLINSQSGITSKKEKKSLRPNNLISKDKKKKKPKLN